MKAKSLFLLSLSLVSVNVMANTGYAVSPWDDPLPRIAQMSAEERRLLQLRWERLPPEEQAQLRQQLREQLLELPPEQREFRRRQILEGWREQPGRDREYRMRETGERRGFHMDDRNDQEDGTGHGFGRGFERRNVSGDRPGRR